MSVDFAGVLTGKGTNFAEALPQVATDHSGRRDRECDQSHLGRGRQQRVPRQHPDRVPERSRLAEYRLAGVPGD